MTDEARKKIEELVERVEARCRANEKDLQRALLLIDGDEPVPKRKRQSIYDRRPGVPYQPIVQYLNNLAGKHFQVTRETVRTINKRLDEGMRPEDFATVTEKMVKRWGGRKNDDFDGDKYLRPSTLFNGKMEERLHG